MKSYSSPINFTALEDSDLEFEQYHATKYEKEINHFKKTGELFISLFSNSKRINRDSGGDNIYLIAVRIFQDTRCAFILTLKGLYPQASALLRSTLESLNLIYDFKYNPTHEDIWFKASQRKREKLFKVSEVRKRLREVKVKTVEVSTGLYSLLSNWSVHTNLESYLWYVETKDKKVFYHWAGYGSAKKDDALILSCLFALSEGLFVITEEEIYAHDKNWLKDYYIWKKEHLEFAKKFGKIFGDEEIYKVEFKLPNIEAI